MGIIDVIIICILALGFISGLQKGLLASFLATIALAAAWFIAAATYGRLAEMLRGSTLDAWLISTEVTDAATVSAIFNTVSFALILLIAFAALLLVTNLLNNVFRFPQLRVFDGLLGGILGILRAFVLLLVMISAIKLVFSPVNTEIVDGLLSGSTLGRLIKDVDILSTLH